MYRDKQTQLVKFSQIGHLILFHATFEKNMNTRYEANAIFVLFFRDGSISECC